MTLHMPVWMQPVASDPTYPNGIPFDGQTLRNSISAMLGVLGFGGGQQGVVGNPSGGFLVTQRGAGANFSVDVAAGYAYITGDDVTSQGSYETWNDATVNVSTFSGGGSISAPGSGTRVHRLVLQIEDHLNNGSWAAGTYNATLLLLQDTGSGTPAEPGSALTLAFVSISAGQASILNANISDQRPVLGTGLTDVTPFSPTAVTPTVAQASKYWPISAAQMVQGARFEDTIEGQYIQNVVGPAPRWFINFDGSSTLIIAFAGSNPNVTGTFGWKVQLSATILSTGTSGQALVTATLLIAQFGSANYSEDWTMSQVVTINTNNPTQLGLDYNWTSAPGGNASITSYASAFKRILP